jgi:hypothetical protein
VNSEGLPLEILLSEFKDNDIIPDWPDFIDEAIKCNWNLDSLRTKIEISTGDVYGPLHRDEVLKRFDIFVKHKRV